MSHHVLNSSSRLLVLALALSPLLLFQNCAQNFDLSSVGDATTMGDELMRPSSFRIDEGTGYTRHRHVPVHLVSPDAREVLVTQSPDCAPGDGESWQPMGASLVYPLPAENAAYRLFVKFRTAPGDLGKAIAVETSCTGAPVIHDGLRPTAEILNPEPYVTAQDQLRLEVDARDDREVTHVRCALYNTSSPAGRGFDCTRPGDVTPLAPGENRIEAVAYDLAGNASPVDAFRFFVDRQKPVVTISSPADGAELAQPRVTFNFNVTDNHRPEAALRRCRVEKTDGTVVEDWRACTRGNQHTTPALTNGDYRFRVRAQDLAGNESDVVTRAFRVRAVAGAFSVTGVTDTGGGDATADAWLAGNLRPVVHWQASDGAVRYELTILNAAGTTEVCPVVDVAAPAVPAATLSAAANCASALANGGTYQARVTAYSATSQATAAAPFTFGADNVAPVARVAQFSLALAKAELRVSVDTDFSGLKKIECRHVYRPEGAGSVVSAAHDCRALTVYESADHRPGAHEIRVETEDFAGNQRSATVHSYTVLATDCAKLGGPLTACPLAHDTFARAGGATLTAAADVYPWRHHLDADLQGRVAYGGIYPQTQFGPWPAASPQEGLVLAGEGGKEIFLISKPFDLAGYSQATVSFDYVTLGLESPAALKLQFCMGTADACGAGATPDAAKLADANLWRDVKTFANNVNDALTGVGVPASEWQEGTHVWALTEYPLGEVVLRFRYQFPAGFASPPTSLDDGVMIDNFKILVDRP